MKNSEEKKIQAILILEVIGKPQKFLVSTLENLTAQINQEEGVRLVSKKIKEPKKMEEKPEIATPAGREVKIEEQKDFYVSFAEIEVEAKDLFSLMALLYKYMPAHIEILSPENLDIANYHWNQVLNDLIRRLHAYDEIARVLQVEKSILESKLKSVLEDNIVVPKNKSKIKKKSKKGK